MTRATARGSVLVSEVRGRIGNQLFSLAAGFAAARSTNRSLLVDLSWFEEPGVTKRPEILGFDWSFATDMVFGTQPRRGIDRYSFRGATWLQNGASLASGRRIPATLRARHVGHEPRLDRAREYARLTGLYQSAGHVEQACNLGLPRRLDPVSESSWLAALRARALEERPVVVIVRLADYRRHRETLGLLSPAYFSEAFERLGSAADRPVWLFSDEGAAGLEFLPPAVRRRAWVVPQPAETAREHVLLGAALGSAYVIPNSTFAWWAAWMSGAHTPVVAPDPWLRRRSAVGVHPESWIRVPSRWTLD